MVNRIPLVIEAVNGMIQLVEQMDYAVMVVVIYIYCHSIDWLCVKWLSRQRR